MTNDEILSKEELSELLRELQIAVDEGKTSEGNKNTFPRIVYWPYIEQDVVASGEAYSNLVTFQISFFARTPQHAKFKELRKKLRKKGLHPMYSHEYVENDPIFSKTWHTFFSVDVLEEIENE